MSNGTRQGSVLSPYLFTRYIREMLYDVVSSSVGCNIGGIFVNILAYADDVVLLAPSWAALQFLINRLSSSIATIDMSCNVNKTVCMSFPPKCRFKVLATDFPPLHLGNCLLKFVHSFRYLGHVLTCDLSDNDDIARELRNLFVRTNILKRKFGKCSVPVKLVLFKCYCLCMYDNYCSMVTLLSGFHW